MEARRFQIGHDRVDERPRQAPLVPERRAEATAAGALEGLEQPVGTLSGGQRQVVAIARAIHFGARVLILDEPTAALGVAQSGLVLRYIAQAAREQGIGVIFITHNPHHAYLVGDHFMVLRRGEVDLDTPRAALTEAIDRAAAPTVRS